MAQPVWAREHVERYWKTGGIDGHIWTGFDGKGNFPCLLLTTKGRLSGKERTTPLIYGRDKDAFVVIGSQGGRPTHPNWYLNLQANPDVGVQVKDDVFTAASRTAKAGECRLLWPMMAKIYPPYDDYREKVIDHREIPVVILTRA
jgi:deazaflavin-dependent oxidoreductase (nitroreductase family)